MSWSRLQWIRGKTAIAERLAAGECGGAYAEAVIILSSAISAIAADAWPGERIDRKRFVELFKDFCNPTLHPVRISVPLLIGYLRGSGKAAEERVIRERFMDFVPSRVLTGDDTDQEESTILSCCPTLAPKEVREFSYANVLYREVRSAFVHQYRSGGKADPWPLTEESEDSISYGNWYGEPDRHIHFPVGWIRLVAESTADAVDQKGSAIPMVHPVVWWIDGP